MAPLPSSLTKAHSILSRATDVAAMIKPRRFIAAPSFAQVARRGIDDSSDGMINLMLTVLGLILLALILASILFFLFRRRRRLLRQRLQGLQGLPSYHETKQTQRGLTIDTSHNGRSSFVYIGRDCQPMLQNPNSPPHSPDNVPEIHITFPDEDDEQGRPKSGRVLVVRVGENATVGLEPMHQEQLPAYEKEDKGQFQSIDMDQIGGLKEKDRVLFQ